MSGLLWPRQPRLQQSPSGVARSSRDQGRHPDPESRRADHGADVRSDHLSLNPIEGRHRGSPGIDRRKEGLDRFQEWSGGSFRRICSAGTVSGGIGTWNTTGSARQSASDTRQCRRKFRACGLSVLQPAVLPEPATVLRSVGHYSREGGGSVAYQRATHLQGRAEWRAGDALRRARRCEPALSRDDRSGLHPDAGSG